MTPVGSVRTSTETVGDLDIAVQTNDPAAVMDTFTTMPSVRRILGAGPAKSAVIVDGGIQIDLRVVSEGQ
jgi:DNA polymerase (family 10)